MNANVHMSVGVATATGVALLIPTMQCESLIYYPICLGCAVVGALIPDIDANGESKAKKEFKKVMSYLAILVAFIICSSLITGDISSIVKNFITSIRGIGFLGFLLCCIIGYKSDHRKFTHWLIGLVCFTFCFTLATDIKLGLWFGFGMLSHQVADMLNKKKITWLYPLKIDFARYICKASSTLSTVIGFVSVGLSCVFLSLLIK